MTDGRSATPIQGETAFADIADIVQLLNRYGLAIDARRWDLFDTIFDPDAAFDYFGTIWTGLASFKADFASAHEPMTGTQHVSANPFVTIDGPSATALSYCQWRLIRTGTRGGDSYWGTAWFDDRLHMTEPGWRIVARRCGLLWTEGNPLVGGANGPPACQPLHLAAETGPTGLGRPEGVCEE